MMQPMSRLALRAVLLQALLVTASCILARAQASDVDELVIGVLLGATKNSYQFVPATAAFDIDFAKNFNASLVSRFGPAVVSIPNLHPKLRIRTYFVNTDGNPDISLDGALDLMLGRSGYTSVNGLVGAHYSSLSKPIASLGTTLKVPQISPGSTNPSLSNKQVYGYFLRTVPPDNIQGRALWRYMVDFQIPGATVVYSAEPYGEGIFSVVSGLAQSADLSAKVAGVQLRYMPTDWDEDEAQSTIDVAVSFRRKLLLVAIASSILPPFLLALKGRGLWAPVYQIFGVESLTDGNVKNLFPGTLAFRPFSQGALYPKYWELWQQLQNEDYAGPEAMARLRLDAWKPEGGLFDPTLIDQDWFSLEHLLNPFMLFLFDALYTFAFAFNALLTRGVEKDDIRGQTLLDEVRATKFEGVTGPVAFDENGDRLGDYVFVVLQAVGNNGSGWMTGGTFSPSSDTFVLHGNATVLWSDGSHSRFVPQTFTACEPGSFRTALGLCKECAPGWSSEGGDAPECTACPLGKHASRSGSASCDLCEPGKAAGVLASAGCTACAAGSYTGGSGASMCTFCGRGSYSSAEASTSCTPCLPGLTTENIATMSSRACVCRETTFMVKDLSGCRQCPEGMSCALGSTEANLASALRMDVPLESLGPYPEAKPGYMTRTSSPLTVYRCLQAARCPGGHPGLCTNGFDGEAVACGICKPAHYKSPGECLPCEDAGAIAMPLILSSVFALILIALVTFAVNRPARAQTTYSLTIVSIAGFMATGVQMLGGVFRQIGVNWVQPIKAISEALSFCILDLELTRLDCIVGTRPISGYTCRQILAPLCAPVVLLALLYKKKATPETQVRQEFANSLGAIYNTLFISIVMSGISPMICFSHPEGSGSSMHSNPSILCWDRADHKVMAAVGIVTCVAVPLPFCATVAYFVAVYKRRVASSRGSSGFLASFRFWHARFTPQCYYYGAVLLARNLCICLVPVVISDNPAASVCVVCLIFCALILLQQRLRPWRSELANDVDGAMSMCLVLLLVCGALSTNMTASVGFVQKFGLGTLIAFMLAALASLTVTVYQSFKPKPWYDDFVSHHKKDAAAQARFIKVMLQSKAKRSVFIDSDDLRELWTLFDIVKTKVGRLILYLTRDTLSRPWCAGEIVSAFAVRQRLEIVVVETPSYKGISREQMDDLESYLDLSGCSLAEYGVAIQDVHSAYSTLFRSGEPSFRLESECYGTQRFERLVGNLLGSKLARGATSREVPQAPGMVVFSSDPFDDEAVAATGILHGKLREHVLRLSSQRLCSLVDFRCDCLDALACAVSEARCVIVVLSRRTLDSLHQLAAIVAAQEADLPMVVPLSMPSFMFPSPDYYEQTFPRMWGSDSAQAAEAMKAFFKRIAISFPTHASDSILDNQAKEVLARIPDDGKHKVGRMPRRPLIPGQLRSTGAIPAGDPDAAANTKTLSTSPMEAEPMFVVRGGLVNL